MAQKLGARTITYDFHCCISADELIQQIYENHLTDNMLFERFKKKFKTAARPIRSCLEAVSNIVLAETPAVVDRLIPGERVSVK